MAGQLGHALYWTGWTLAGAWGLFFLGEAIEGVIRGEVDVAFLVAVGVAFFWGLGRTARYALAGT
jgi:hypothetical protein